MPLARGFLDMLNDCVIQGALGFVLSNNYVNSIFMLIKSIFNFNQHKIAD